MNHSTNSAAELDQPGTQRMIGGDAFKTPVGPTTMIGGCC